jgi:molecular chaperone GrpE (heat shock protein)
MADDKNPIIDLSQIQDSEQKAALGDDILSLEEELLGSGSKPAATGTSASSAKKTQPLESKFHIPQAVKTENPELIPLILNTESMDDEEREYWFQILPIMTPEQIAKFKNILVTEKQQLAKLDEEYETELAKINEKHLQEWQEFESKQERTTRQQQEQAQEAQESSTEEDLLKKLQEL